MSFIEEIKNTAKKDIKTIVLPEATDKRILEATDIILKEGFAKIILLGDEDIILQTANENGLDVSYACIINPIKSNKYEEYANKLYELRKEKGLTIDGAYKLVKDTVYFGMMMLKNGDCDGLVSGAIHSTADTLRPALQILKTAQGTKLVSAFFLMIIPNCEYGEDGIFVFSDCGLNQDPNAEELSEIAISSSKSYENLTGKKANVAMLSFSTYGSAISDSTKKVIEATKLVRKKDSSIIIDGELQLDAAIVPEVAKSKAPNSSVAGHANTLIFPNLDAGNIGYKLVQRFAKAEAYGPLCQGIAKPVNDLSRGCSAKDIVGVVAITAVQAQEI